MVKLKIWIRLEYQINYIGAIGNTHCALAPGALWSHCKVRLNTFRDDFERHISGGCCPYHSGKGA